MFNTRIASMTNIVNSVRFTEGESILTEVSLLFNYLIGATAAALKLSLGTCSQNLRLASVNS